MDYILDCTKQIVFLICNRYQSQIQTQKGPLPRKWSFLGLNPRLIRLPGHLLFRFRS